MPDPPLVSRLCKGLKLLEAIRLAPAGTVKVQKMLLTGGEGCVRGGETGIFTPMCVHLRGCVCVCCMCAAYVSA